MTLKKDVVVLIRACLGRTLVGQLFIHGKVTTTLLKAKEVQKFTDRLVNIAKEVFKL
ncbi:MAG: hypothetical protein CMB73_05930 [Euryarchaeota archaeon]|nr:hypothetical protein [Euryarchaeota archaeon]